MRLFDVDALSFDCYGTLIDWEAGLTTALGAWAARRDVDVGTDALLSAYGRHESVVQTTHPSTAYAEVVGLSLRALGAELGVEVTDEDAAAIGSSVGDWPAFDDSAAALRTLAESYALIVLSNVDRASFERSRARLGVEFTAVVTAEDVGAYKPSPLMFDALLATARDLGIGDGRLLHVAQSLFHDHVPAKAIGLPTVWINRRSGRDGWGATPPPPERVVPDAEFPSMAAFAAAVSGS